MFLNGVNQPEVTMYLAGYARLPEVPAYCIPDDVPCTPAVRNEINAWALKQFGTRCKFDGRLIDIPFKTYMKIDGTKFVSESTWNWMKERV